MEYQEGRDGTVSGSAKDKKKECGRWTMTTNPGEGKWWDLK